MKNGTTLSRWFRLPNVGKESVVDLPSWIVEVWLTRSFTWFAPVARGECCQVTSAPGKRSMVTFDAGAKIGLGGLCMTHCGTACEKPKTARWHRRPPLLTANRSRLRIKLENAATTREKRSRGANDIWPWTPWG